MNYLARLEHPHWEVETPVVGTSDPPQCRYAYLVRVGVTTPLRQYARVGEHGEIVELVDAHVEQNAADAGRWTVMEAQ